MNNKEEINIGLLGENIACRFLEEKGHAIKERNYRKKFGEIDVITTSYHYKNKDNILTKIWSFPYKIIHFIEVKTKKTVFDNLVVNGKVSDVSYETQDMFQPVDNIHPLKIERLKKAIDSYVSKNVPHETKSDEEFLWQFDVVSVFVDPKEKKSRVKFIEDVVI